MSYRTDKTQGTSHNTLATNNHTITQYPKLRWIEGLGQEVRYLVRRVEVRQLDLTAMNSLANKVMPVVDVTHPTMVAWVIGELDRCLVVLQENEGP